LTILAFLSQISLPVHPLKVSIVLALKFKSFLKPLLSSCARITI